MSTPNRNYWGGSTVRGGKVRQLDAKTFPELLGNHFNTPVCLPYTRAEWEAMRSAVSDAEEQLALDKNPDTQAAYRKAKDTYDSAKDCPYVCAVSFKQGTTLRNDANADRLNLACFDIDDHDLARDFVTAPEALADALWPFNFVATLTASSTPEHPRLRIIVDVSPCDPEWHKRIVFHLARLLGLPKTWSGHRESNTLSQPFYRPVKLEGEDFTSVIASRTTGVPLETKDIPEEVVEEVERTYAYQHGGGTDDEADLSNLPVPGLTVEDIREPLGAIDPDCHYSVWCEIFCAGLHQFRGEEEAQEMFELLVEWSEGGVKFRGVEECYAKWRSFRPGYKGRRPVTIKSLFRHAMDAGWSNTKVAGKIKANVTERIRDCDDVDVLMNEGPGWISEMPFKNDLVEESLMDVLSKRIASLKGPRLAINTIRKQVGKSRRQIKAAEASTSVPAWLRPWCFITTLDRWYSTITGNMLTTEAFNRTYSIHFMPTNPEDEAMKTNKPVVLPSDFALNTPDMVQKVEGILYDPRDNGADGYIKIDDRMFVNGYRANTVPKLDEKNSAKAGKAFQRLLKEQIEDPEHRAHLTDMIAHMVQFPGVRIRQSMCLQGVQGSGKTFISKFLTAALGVANVKIAGPTEITGSFNDWATEAVAVVIEEIWVQGKSRAEIMNRLKPLITNDDIAINRKFRDSVTVPNCTSWMAFSNHHNALFLEEGDRRWWVVKSCLQSKHQVLELNEKIIGGMRFFDYMGYVIKHLAGALRHYFLNYAIRPSFNPNGEAPDTPWRHEMIESSKNILHKRIEDLLEDDLPLVGTDIIYYPDLESRTSRESKNNHDPAHFLHVLGYQPYEGGKRFPVNGDRGPIWTHRERFDEALGDPHEILVERYSRKPDELL